eukprot:PITA_25186
MLRRSKRIALQQRKEIIPNLPEDIARECLLRVPYKWHSTLKLEQENRNRGAVENVRRIVVIDPVTRTWEMLRQNLNFPTGNIPLLCACVCVNGKLVLIGGRYPESSRDMKAVYLFDFASAKWRRGTDMPTQRYNFACSVSPSTGFIYVAGGTDIAQDLRTAEAYNVEEDRWETLPPMTQLQGACRGVFLGEKFLCESANNVEFFCEKTGVWTTDYLFPIEQSFFSCVVASGDLYIMKYNAGENEIVIQSGLRSVAPYTAQWRGHIFGTKLSAPGSRRHFCYMLNLSTNEWIEFVIPRKFAGINMAAATVEI